MLASPVTPGHSLVIPRRHVADGFALHQPEWNAAVGLNSSVAVGQTVFHAHWHLIPRRQGDCGEAGVLNIAGQGSSQ
ncbi:HIT family protein [Cyanobium sp. WKJ7-Wakatipu]|uniref:HIT family protein n=1 Tax=Cyanobium sp. WKJ7-Wakatipu TaxID=2823726 RepID=UPI0037BE3806